MDNLLKNVKDKALACVFRETFSIECLNNESAFVQISFC